MPSSTSYTFERGTPERRATSYPVEPGRASSATYTLASYAVQPRCCDPVTTSRPSPPFFDNSLCSYYYGGKEVLRHAPSLRLRGWAAARLRGSAVARHAAPRLRGTRLRGCAARGSAVARPRGYTATRLRGRYRRRSFRHHDLTGGTAAFRGEPCHGRGRRFSGCLSQCRMPFPASGSSANLGMTCRCAWNTCRPAAAPAFHPTL